MKTLTANAKKFLSKSPAHIQTLMGYKFYEHPELGEDTYLLCITPCGNFYSTCFMERLDHEDLQYQIEEWRKTKNTFQG